jgi:hypothetical protein
MAWLRYPYPKDVEEPPVYEHVRIHAQYGSVIGQRGDLHLAVSFFHYLF